VPRSRVSTGTPWEEAVGYSRAVRVGNTIAVSGTTAPGADAYEQTRNAFQIIARALADAGASLEDVIRTRIFVTDISQGGSDRPRPRRSFRQDQTSLNDGRSFGFDLTRVFGRNRSRRNRYDVGRAAPVSW
jgi:enamine deaminase RidA (YjgF/YER057c/UK114 family)